MLCFQGIFNTPYFCRRTATRWYDAVEKDSRRPDGKLMQDVAKQHGLVMVVPI